MKVEFSRGVRRALGAAHEEACRLGHPYVGTEHMLLGLLNDPESTAVEVLMSQGITPRVLRDRIDAAVRPGGASPSGKQPYTGLAKRALEYAMKETGPGTMEPEHLLIGLLLERQGIAAVLLNQLGLTEAQVREAVIDRTSRTGTGPFRITIDEASDRSIYEQIVERVQEGAATGELEPGQRLPTVRRLADDLDIAPGTVARAYGELERMGVVITEGARGTRVAPREMARRPHVDLDALTGLIRPVAVAAYHMGAGAPDLRLALESAMQGIFTDPDT